MVDASSLLRVEEEGDGDEGDLIPAKLGPLRRRLALRYELASRELAVVNFLAAGVSPR